MKKIRILMLSALLLTAFSNVSAQYDDMYFKPSSKVKQSAKPIMRSDASVSQDNDEAYYCGSDRNVDEYNRRDKFNSSYANHLRDSLRMSDSILVSRKDYENSLNLKRFDRNYTVVLVLDDPWYYDPWYADPWYYDRWYYDRWRWHYAWNDPWYNPWYNPWYYGPRWTWTWNSWGWRHNGGIVWHRGSYISAPLSNYHRGGAMTYTRDNRGITNRFQYNGSRPGTTTPNRYGPSRTTTDRRTTGNTTTTTPRRGTMGSPYSSSRDGYSSSRDTHSSTRDSYSNSFNNSSSNSRNTMSGSSFGGSSYGGGSMSRGGMGGGGFNRGGGGMMRGAGRR